VQQVGAAASRRQTRTARRSSNGLGRSALSYAFETSRRGRRSHRARWRTPARPRAHGSPGGRQPGGEVGDVPDDPSVAAGKHQQDSLMPCSHLPHKLLTTAHWILITESMLQVRWAAACCPGAAADTAQAPAQARPDPASSDAATPTARGQGGRARPASRPPGWATGRGRRRPSTTAHPAAAPAKASPPQRWSRPGDTSSPRRRWTPGYGAQRQRTGEGPCRSCCPGPSAVTARSGPARGTAIGSTTMDGEQPGEVAGWRPARPRPAA
jgi:hypothetical protein